MGIPKNHNIDIGMTFDQKELIKKKAEELNLSQSNFCLCGILSICHQMDNPKLEIIMIPQRSRFIFEEVKEDG